MRLSPRSRPVDVAYHLSLPIPRVGMGVWEVDFSPMTVTILSSWLFAESQGSLPMLAIEGLQLLDKIAFAHPNTLQT